MLTLGESLFFVTLPFPYPFNLGSISSTKSVKSHPLPCFISNQKERTPLLRPGPEFLSGERVLAFSVFCFCDQPHTILFVFIECGNSDKLGRVAVGPIPILLSGSDRLDFHFDSFNLCRYHFTARGRTRNHCGSNIGGCGRNGAILDPIFPGLASQSPSGTSRVVDVVAGKAKNESDFSS